MPGLVLVALSTIICLIRWRRPSDYWTAYRIGLCVLVILTLLGNYGLWYGATHAS